MQNINYLFFEAKLRAFYILFSFIITLVISCFYYIEMIYLIGRPFLELQHKFIFIDLTEAFYTILNICVVFTFFFIIPYVVYQLWVFFIPSFYTFERKKINLFLLVFLFLMIGQVHLIYFKLLPTICEFLLSFEIASTWNSPNNGTCQSSVPGSFSPKYQAASDTMFETSLLVIELTARIKSYVKLIIRIFCFLILLFQIPVFFFLLFQWKLIDVHELCKNRKVFFFIALLLSALITPPDLVSQLTITCILIAVYEIVIFMGFFIDLKIAQKISRFVLVKKQT